MHDFITSKFNLAQYFIAFEIYLQGFEILEDQIHTPLNSRNPSKFSLLRWKGCQDTVLREEVQENEEDGDAYSMLLEQKGAQAKKLFQALHILTNTFVVESSVCNQTDLFKKMLYPTSPDEKCIPTSDAKYLDHYGFYIALMEEDGEVLTVATIR